MRNVVLFCSMLCGFTEFSSAEEQGLASYYQYPRTRGLIAAHRTLAMGSQVRVLNLDNRRSAVMRIVDRGPFIAGRVIDVSVEAAEALGLRDAGLAHVRIDSVSPEASHASPRPDLPAVAAAPAGSRPGRKWPSSR